MYKTCTRCGRIHDAGYKCTANRFYKQTDEVKLRNTYKWKQKSKEIRYESNFLCEVCKNQDHYFNYKDLEVHHIEKLKNRPTGLLDDENLICLCKYHHKLADAGKIDAEYLKELARRRDAEGTPRGLET